MISCSETVSLGHPDKTADAIASYLLDAYMSNDPKVRFALEVQLKDQTCNIAGEVTSTWKPSDGEIAELVRDAIRKVGYTAEYAAKWPDGATLNADEVVVNNFIGRQSPDIAQGVDREGWGDQGVFAGLAVNNQKCNYLPTDVYLAKEIEKSLYGYAKGGIIPIGLDIKALVSIGENEEVEQVIVAVPVTEENEAQIKRFVGDVIFAILSNNNKRCGNIIINGTGAYVVHSTVGDAGVVGRKLAVDFYGLNCPIGGGAPWGKDPTKADVTLNIAARYFSLKTLLENGDKYKKVFTKISCCIGKSQCLVVQTDENGDVIKSENADLRPSELIKKLGLDGKPDQNTFFEMCEKGLFFNADRLALSTTEN